MTTAVAAGCGIAEPEYEPPGPLPGADAAPAPDVADAGTAEDAATDVDAGGTPPVDGPGTPVGPAGGSLQLGRLTVEIPPLALPSVVSVEIREVATEHAPGAVGEAYVVTPSDVALGLPATVRYRIEEDSTPAWSPAAPVLATGQHGVWYALADRGRDEAGHSGKVDRFGLFAPVPAAKALLSGIELPGRPVLEARAGVHAEASAACFDPSRDVEAVLRLSLGGAAPAAVEVTVELRDGTARSGEHYGAPAAAAVALDAGRRRGEVRVPLTGSGGGPDGASFFALPRAGDLRLRPVELRLCPEAPAGGTVELAEAEVTVTEGGTIDAVLLVAGGGEDAWVDLGLRPVDGPHGVPAWPGTADGETFRVDLVPDEQGEVSWSLPAPPDDDKAFGDLELELRIERTGGVEPGPRDRMRVVVQDDEAGGGLIGFAAPVFFATEGGGRIPVSVARWGRTAGVATVRYATVAGSGPNGAQAGVSFRETSGELVWGADEADARSFEITPLDDTDLDAPEVLSVELTDARADALADLAHTALVVILDDGGGAGLAEVTGPVSAGRTPGELRVPVDRLGATYLPLEVEWVPAGGTARLGVDFEWQTGTLTWPPGDAETRPVVFSAATVGGGTGGGGARPRFVGLRLVAPEGALAVGPSHLVALPALAGRPSVGFDRAVAEVSEADPAVRLDVVRTGELLGTVLVCVTTYDDTATALGDEADYDGGQRLVELSAGVASAGVTIKIERDERNESDERFVVVARPVVAEAAEGDEPDCRDDAVDEAYDLGEAWIAEVTIRDDDDDVRVRGLVFRDLNADGRRQRGEGGVSGVTVHLRDGCDTDEDHDSALTGDDGGFTLNPPGEGTFAVVTDENGRLVTTHPGNCAVEVTRDDAVVLVEVGVARGAAVGGTVFEDLDADREPGAGEPGFEDVEVWVFEQEEGGCDSPPALCHDATACRSARTDEAGEFQVSGLPDGRYCVVDRGAALDDKVRTGRDPAPVLLRLLGGADEPTRLPRGWTAPCPLDGLVFVDEDYDGVYRADLAEPGVPGVSVDVWWDVDRDGTWSEPRPPLESGADGRLVRPQGQGVLGLAPGSYRVAPQGVPPAGKLVTTHDELPALLEVVREAGGDCTARFHLGIGGDEPPCPLATFEERARIPAPAGRLAGSCGGDGEDRAETTLVWSADRTGEVEITARAAGFVPVVYVRTMPDGQCGKARDELACALAVEPGAPVSVFVDVQEGESYVVVIDGAPPGQWIECAGGECDVTLEEAPVCPAQALPSAPVAADASGSNRLAGTCGGDGAVELTWGWDAPGAGAYVARVTSADGGHVPLATHVHLGEVCGGIGDELDCSPAPVRYGTRTWGEVWLADLAADDAVVLAAEVGGGVLRDVPFEARMLGPLPDPCGAVVVPAGELESVDDEYVWTGPLLAPDDAAVPNLSSHCGGGQSPNRVLRFTAAPGTYDVEASGSGWSPIVAVHTGPAGGDGACASEAVACHRAGRDEAALLEGFVVDEEAEVLVVVDAVPDGSALVDEPANVRVRIRIADLAPPGEGEGEGEGEGG